jgi:pyruvate dehydrogenase E2 component (dihydrolipoamide acetyltransferase)
MAKDIKLPQLGQTMEEGTIVTSLVNVGDKVAKGDVIFEIETDKATLEMESPAEGFVRKILVEIGETVLVNEPILILGEEDEEITQDYLESLGVSADAATETAPPGAAEQPATQAAAAPAPVTVPAEEVAAPAGVKVVRLPQLGQTMEEGTIVTTMIATGDTVAKGDVIFEIETDKATLEMESPAEGIAKMILVQTGETIEVNAPILVLAPADVEVTQEYIDSLAAAGAVAVAAQPEAAEIEEPEVTAPAAQKPGERIFASPRAKMIAAELGVDLSRVIPSVGAVRITEADVRRAAASGTPPVGTPMYSLGQKIRVNRLQKIVGERMLESKREIPCFYLNIKVDMTELIKLRAKMNKSGDVKVSFNDFIIKAVALGLERYPIMTGQLDGTHIQLADQIDIGLAISTDKGLVAPMIKDVAAKNVRQISAYGKSLVERAKSGSLSLDDLEGGCITISNLGGFGIDSFIPIVVPGQCSILGVGRITDTCMPIDRNIMVRKIMNLNLSVDHKVANGADAAQFLDYVKKMLEHTSTFE